MSKKITIETLKKQLDQHTKELGDVSTEINRLQINSVDYGALNRALTHKIDQHEKMHHQPRRWFSKKIAAQVILGGLLLLGCSSYWIWNNTGTLLITAICWILVVVPTLWVLAGLAIGEIE